MKLPNAESAVVVKEKITEYLLNPLHPDGASKARWFSALGFTVEDWEVLAAALRKVAHDWPIANTIESAHGLKYIIEGAFENPSGKPALIRTVWIVDLGERAPRLVTAYPRDERA